MVKYQLVNPLPIGAKKNDYTKSFNSANTAAKTFFKEIRKNIKNKENYKFLFSIKNMATDEVEHFVGNYYEKKNELTGGAKHVISVEQYFISKQNVEDDILNINAMTGGRKRRTKKRRSRKKKSRSRKDDSDSDSDSETANIGLRPIVNYLQSAILSSDGNTFYMYSPFAYENIYYTDYIVTDGFISWPELMFPYSMYPYFVDTYFPPLI